MRVGDEIDDYCSRCKRNTDHAVVAMVGEAAKRVRCRTCNNEHNYRPSRKIQGQMSKEEAFQKVLASVMAQQSGEEKKKKKK
jgi:hypothetical protein